MGAAFGLVLADCGFQPLAKALGRGDALEDLDDGAVDGAGGGFYAVGAEITGDGGDAGQESEAADVGFDLVFDLAVGGFAELFLEVSPGVVWPLRTVSPSLVM